jgi:uncharacterized protein (DUF2147 family)
MLFEETEYQKFFKTSLKKFGVGSPAEFKNDQEKKKFFDYIDKNWKGEKNEETIEEVDMNKIGEKHAEIVSEGNAFLKARSIAMWEGKNEFEFNGKIFPLIKISGE